MPAAGELARLLGRVVHRRPDADTVLDGGLTFRLTLPETFGAEQLLTLTDGAAGQGSDRSVRSGSRSPRQGPPSRRTVRHSA